MSKFSFNLEDRGIGGWLARNIEKITLAVAGLVLIGLFTQGFVTPGLEPSRNPAKLVETAVSTQASINRDVWDVIGRKELVKFTHQTRVEMSRAETPFSEYKTSPLFSPLFPLDQKRGDPKVLAPTDIEITVAHGPLLLRPYKNYIDPMAGTTVNPEIEAEKPKRRPTRPTRPRRGGDEEEYFNEGLEEGLGEIEEAKKYVTLSPAQIAAFQPGTSQQSVQPGYGQESGYNPGSASGAYFGTYVVGVKALVPHELQKAEFEAAFANAVGFNATRDRPHYIRLEVQRADVTDSADVELADDDKRWKLLTDTLTEYKTSVRFGAIPPELADPRYLVPSVLTFPVPPLLLTDVTDLYLHSEVPQRLAQLRNTGEEGDDPGTDGTGTDPAKPDDGGLPGGGLPGDGRLASGGPIQPEGDFGSGGLTGSTPLPPELMLDKARGGAEGVAEAGYDSGDGYGTEGFGPGESAFSFEAMDGVEHKMIRFFDFKVVPERKYRYRIRIRLLDPNSPNIPATLLGGAGISESPEPGDFGESPATTTTGTALPNRMLQDEVIDRLNKVKSADDKTRDADPAPKTTAVTVASGTYWRYSPWSEPSPIASVPARPEMMLAGPATAPRAVPIDYNAGIFMEIGDHETELAAVLWDKKYAVNVPVKRKVKRGSFLNFKSPADVVHPVRMIVRRFAEYPFDLNSMVVDIRGGEQLPGFDQKDPVMTAPSEVLLVNSKGELISSDETTAAEEYRKWLLIEDQPEIPDTTYGEEFYPGEEEGLPLGRGGRGFDS